MFAASTMVDMADGKKKKIEDLQIGDSIYADEKGDDTVYVVFSSFEKNMLRIEISTGNKLTLTADQNLYTPTGKIEARYIRIGVDIFTRDGVVTVVSVDTIDYDDIVHGFNCLNPITASCNEILVLV